MSEERTEYHALSDSNPPRTHQPRAPQSGAPPHPTEPLRANLNLPKTVLDPKDTKCFSQRKCFLSSLAGAEPESVITRAGIHPPGPSRGGSRHKDVCCCVTTVADLLEKQVSHAGPSNSTYSHVTSGAHLEVTEGNGRGPRLVEGCPRPGSSDAG